MRLKSLIVLLVIFAVLAALGVAKKAGRERRLREAAAQTRTVCLTQEFDEDLISGIILYKGESPLKGEVPDDKKIALSRRDGAWVLANRNDIPARPDRVNNLIRSIENVCGERRGVSAGVFPDFGIADDEGLHVVVQGEAGQEIAHLVYGVKIPRLGVGFCRLAGSEETLMIETGLPFSLGIHGPESELADRSFVQWRIYSDKVKEAERIEVTKAGERPFLLIKGEDGTWTFDPPKRRQKVDTEKVDGLLKVLAEIKGRDLVDPEEGAEYGFDEAGVRVVATVLGGGGVLPSVFDIRVGKKVPDREGMTFVKALPQDIIYHVPENAAGNLVVGRKDFVASRRKK